MHGGWEDNSRARRDNDGDRRDNRSRDLHGDSRHGVRNCFCGAFIHFVPAGASVGLDLK